MFPPCLLGLIALSACTACHSDGGWDGFDTPNGDDASVRPRSDPAPASSGPLAYLDGEPLGFTTGPDGASAGLGDAMLDAAGGEALADLVLERQLRQQLDTRDLAISEDDLVDEKRDLLASLSDDPDTAARLLDNLRVTRRLGDRRFSALLWRNAALRMLVRDDVTIDEPLLRQAFEVNHGRRVQARLLTVASLADARSARRRIDRGEAFADVAADLSTDASAARGGLLPPISPVDPTYPRSIRNAVAKLGVGDLTDIIALDSGYAILQGMGEVPADDLSYKDAKPELERRLRNRLERLRMESLARTLLQRADVTVLNPTLAQRWRERLDAAGAEQ